MRTLIVLNNSALIEAVLKYSAQITTASSAGSSLMMVIPRKRRVEFEAAKETIRRTQEYPHLSGFQKKIRVGHLVKEILREAREGDYELIILAAPAAKKSGLVKFKSLLTRIVEGTPGSTLIVRGPATTIKRILLCDSGSGSAIALQDITTRVIGLLNNLEGITILHVMSQVSAGPGVPGVQLRSDAEYLINSDTPEGDLLERDIKHLSQAGIQPVPKIRHGLVVDELLHEAQTGGYDLAIIGGHVPAGWQGFLLDNLAEKIIDQIELPLLIVKPGTAAGLEDESRRITRKLSR